MATFAYKAIDEDGEVISGTLDSVDLEYATLALTSKNLFILKIKQTSELVNRLSLFLNRVNRRNIIEFGRNMASELRAGIPMLDALEDLAQTTDSKAMKNAIFDVKERILSGSTLSDALSANARTFPEILARMTKIGEETGRLELSLQEVADHLQRLDDLSGTIRRALMYPIFVLVVIIIALVFWLIYVMPKMLGVIIEMGVSLPLATRIMLVISNGATHQWYLLPIFAVGILLALKMAQRSESARYFFDHLVMKLPIVKGFALNKRVASFSEQMKILVESGITIDRALMVVAHSIGSEVFKRALMRVKERILSGSRISDALRHEPVFPKMVIRLMDVGETSGSLGDQLSFLSTYFGKRLNDVSERLGKLIEPAMMVTVGIIFVFMIMAILLPMYQVVGQMK
jgi:type II secretory pathway component PulF